MFKYNIYRRHLGNYAVATLEAKKRIKFDDLNLKPGDIIEIQANGASEWYKDRKPINAIKKPPKIDLIEIKKPEIKKPEIEKPNNLTYLSKMICK